MGCARRASCAYCPRWDVRLDARVGCTPAGRMRLLLQTVTSVVSSFRKRCAEISHAQGKRASGARNGAAGRDWRPACARARCVVERLGRGACMWEGAV
eukprot:IDg6591t1